MTQGCKDTGTKVIELPELADDIPYAFDDGSLAGVLKISRKALWATIVENEKGNSIHKHYLIPKRGGKVRHVYEPKPFIKRVQSKILTYLVNPLQTKLGDHVTAYRKGINFLDIIRSHHRLTCPICDAHREGIAPPKHTCYRQGLYIKMDLQDFFHSVRRSHVRNTFKAYGYSHEVASIIAGLVTVRLPHQEGSSQSRKPAPRTPQGFPASGAVCNLVANHFIDGRILRCLDHWNAKLQIPEDKKLIYSRYADDFAILCGWRLKNQQARQIVHDINGIVRDAKFQVNHRKTKITRGDHGKKLLGMSFARKSNIPVKQYRLLRAVLHNHGKEYDAYTHWDGAKTPNHFTSILKGKLDWFAQLNPEKTQKLKERYPKAMAKLEPNL